MLDPENSVYGEKNQIKKYYSQSKKKTFIFTYQKKYIALPTMLDLFWFMKIMIFSYYK